jgi:hypothetical protein
MKSMDYRMSAHKAIFLYEIPHLIEPMGETRKMPAFDDLQKLCFMKLTWNQ